MSRDSSRTQLHLRSPHHADIFETFTRNPLAPEDVIIPQHLQPPNPEDEDDVVPDQHAAFGIQRATQKQREPAWRDLGLEELARRGPEELTTNQSGTSKATSSSIGAELRRKAQQASAGSALPR